MAQNTRSRSANVSVKDFITAWVTVVNKGGHIEDVADMTKLTVDTVYQRGLKIRHQLEKVCPKQAETFAALKRKGTAKASGNNEDALLSIMAQIEGKSIDQLKAENAELLAQRESEQAKELSLTEMVENATAEVTNSEPASEQSGESVSA